MMSESDIDRVAKAAAKEAIEEFNGKYVRTDLCEERSGEIKRGLSRLYYMMGAVALLMVGQLMTFALGHIQ